MFRLYDMRTGQAEQVTTARPGQLVTYLASPSGAGQVSGADLRAALIADLIRRVAERHHLFVNAWQRDPADLADPAGAADSAYSAGAAMRAACDQLNIHPAQFTAHPPDPLDVGIFTPRPDGDPSDAEAGAAKAHWLRPADVQDGADVSGDDVPGDDVPGDDVPGDDPRDGGARHGGALPGGALPGGLTARGLDPLALRLVLLRHHHQQPVVLAWDALAAADQTLSGWRRRVADWARSPSKPMCAQYVADFTDAFDGDLDTPAALALLDALAQDEEIPPGSKFEAFAHLDRLLGLDLASEIGR